MFELLRRKCYHHRRNLYPKASVLPSFMRSHGVEMESWPDWYTVCQEEAAQMPLQPPADDSGPAPPGTPTSGSSSSPVVHDELSPAIGDGEWLSEVHIANLKFLLLHGQLVVPLEMRDLFSTCTR